MSSTYALASLRRASEKCEGLKEFVESSRSMFILRVRKEVEATNCTWFFLVDESNAFLEIRVFGER